MYGTRKKVKVDPKQSKQVAKKAPEEKVEGSKQSDQIIASFKNSLGHSIGTLDLSLDTTPAQMQELVNNLLKDLEA
jgi:hypothetical protein